MKMHSRSTLVCSLAFAIIGFVGDLPNLANAQTDAGVRATVDTEIEAPEAEARKQTDPAACANGDESHLEGSCQVPAARPTNGEGKHESDSATTDNASEAASPKPSAQSRPRRVPEGCQIVLAPTTQIPPLSSSSSGQQQKRQVRTSSSEGGHHHDWGVFTLVPRNRGDRALHGDVVHQIIDADPTSVWHQFYQGEGNLVTSPKLTGGQFEAQLSVLSAIPGIGALTQPSASKNVLPFVPMVDEAGLTRQKYAGAGAVTHYHNLTWFVSNQRVEAGGELFRPSTSLQRHRQRQEANHDLPGNAQKQQEQQGQHTSRSPSWLRENGYCLDNAQPKRKSRLEGAGRGVFSNRAMKKGDVVAPVPVVPILTEDLRTGGKRGNRQQLVTNYCFGHPNSTVHLYPFGPTIHLVNHYNRPNARLRWADQSVEASSQETQTSLTTLPSLDQIRTRSAPKSMLLELVALRNIRKGEEITINYGRGWEDAWWRHVRRWESTHDPESSDGAFAHDHYVPASVIDDAAKTIRTEAEQKENPYESNVVITCFYRYGDRTESERQKAKEASLKSPSQSAIITYRWKMTRGIYDLKNLRPCSILKRKQGDTGRSAYAVRMFNRPNHDESHDDDRIPEDQLHIVTHIPRSAIRFMDKQYTTDQHLKQAFRHPIGLEDNLFPAEWMDLT